MKYNQITTFKTLLNFQYRRFKRLYPLHFFTLIIFFLIEIAKFIAEIKFSLVGLTVKAFEQNNLQAFMQQATLTQSLIPYETI